MAVQTLSQRENSIRDAVAARADAMLADLGRYVAIPTGKNHTPGLDEFRGVVVERLESLGASVETIPGEAAPDWLYGHKGGGQGCAAVPPTVVCRGPHADTEGAVRVLLASHLDTVFEPGCEFQQRGFVTDGHKGGGPGVVDMKGGIVTAIGALEALAEAGVPVAWTYLFNSDEETGSYHSAGALRSQARKHDIGLATEPALPGGELAVERFGSGQFVLEAHGKSAHVGRDFTAGISAVAALARAITHAASMAAPERSKLVSVGPLDGNRATNAVPDLARAWGNARYGDNGVASEVVAELEAMPQKLGMNDPDGLPRLVVKHAFQGRLAKPLTPDVERLALLARGAAESLGQRLPFASTGGVCDGNILQDAGLPTIDTLGVRGGGLHTEQEWIELESLVERSQLMAVLLSRLAAGALGAG